MGFVVFGCWSVSGGGWVGCGLFGRWLGWVVVVFLMGVLRGGFLCWGGGCWLFVGLPWVLQPVSSASRGPPWRCIQWVLSVWFVWFSRTSPGHVLVFLLPFHIVCIGGLGICFCNWLWHPALNIMLTSYLVRVFVYFDWWPGFHLFFPSSRNFNFDLFLLFLSISSLNATFVGCKGVFVQSDSFSLCSVFFDPAGGVRSL